jgi:hypothetical protein
MRYLGFGEDGRVLYGSSVYEDEDHKDQEEELSLDDPIDPRFVSRSASLDEVRAWVQQAPTEIKVCIGELSDEVRLQLPILAYDLFSVPTTVEELGEPDIVLLDGDEILIVAGNPGGWDYTIYRWTPTASAET